MICQPTSSASANIWIVQRRRRCLFLFLITRRNLKPPGWCKDRYPIRLSPTRVCKQLQRSPTRTRLQNLPEFNPPRGEGREGGRGSPPCAAPPRSRPSPAADPALGSRSPYARWRPSPEGKARPRPSSPEHLAGPPCPNLAACPQNTVAWDFSSDLLDSVWFGTHWHRVAEPAIGSLRRRGRDPHLQALSPRM